jgi:predicted site-specific integrase-resolvase
METPEREWVSPRKAAEDLGISVTTIRDWIKAGEVEAREISTGRVVDLEQVREKAMGPAAQAQRSALQHRVADTVSAPEGPHQANLSKTLKELQALARDRD